MKKQHILTVLIASFLIIISFHGVSAQGTLNLKPPSCGENFLDAPCSPQDLKLKINYLFQVIVDLCIISMAVLIPVYAVSGGIQYLLGKPIGMKIARDNLWSVVVGLGVTAGGIGLMIGILSYFGLADWLLAPFRAFAMDSFIPHAYAQGTQLSSPTGGISPYDFFLLVIRLIVRWFIYPAIIAMWVFTGFAYVAAQGNPEKISKVHMYLLVTTIVTVVSFLTESLLFALRGTVQAIGGS